MKSIKIVSVEITEAKIIINSQSSKKTRLKDSFSDNLLLITLLGDNYTILSSSVVQLLQTITITPIANSVRYFVGSTTFRGDVVPVIDLQSFFYGGGLITSRTTSERKSYIALENMEKTVIFQVEQVLGSITRPEESQITDLLSFINPTENPYFSSAFLHEDGRIIVQLDHNQKQCSHLQLFPAGL